MTFLHAEPVTFEHHREPVGIGASAPRLSWITRTAYELELDDGTATGLVEPGESVLVAWPFPPLASRARRGVRVRVHGHDGPASDWSDWPYVETGLLDPADWQAAAAAPARDLLGDPGRPALLVAPSGPPVRRTEILRPAGVLSGPDGETILDFGQNLAGRLRIRVQGPAGQVISMRHAEVLDGGALALRPLRHAAAHDRYILHGDTGPRPTSRASRSTGSATHSSTAGRATASLRDRREAAGRRRRPSRG
ncbi:family 78 glycoside hydrolase catalytic domain [Nonomuraea wenchangensis]